MAELHFTSLKVQRFSDVSLYYKLVPPRVYVI